MKINEKTKFSTRVITITQNEEAAKLPPFQGSSSSCCIYYFEYQRYLIFYPFISLASSLLISHIHRLEKPGNMNVKKKKTNKKKYLFVDIFMFCSVVVFVVDLCWIRLQRENPINDPNLAWVHIFLFFTSLLHNTYLIYVYSLFLGKYDENAKNPDSVGKASN